MSRPMNPAGGAGESIGREPGAQGPGPVGSVTPTDRSAADYTNDVTAVDRPAEPVVRNGPVTTTNPPLDRRELLVRQKERFGGIKFGSAFFGWLAATGLTVILAAVLAAVGIGVGAIADPTVEAGAEQTQAVGLVGGILLLAILFLAYLAGGYVAGRMARFSGARQGLAVWLWGVVMAALITGVAALVGSQYEVVGAFNLPRFQIGEQAGTLATVIGIAVAAGVALIGAIMGGLVGMRFHRRVDRAMESPELSSEADARR